MTWSYSYDLVMYGAANARRLSDVAGEAAVTVEPGWHAKLECST